MQLYFAPLACSLATRIALYEAGADAAYIPVDLRTKRLADGSDFFAVNPMGQVPVLRTDDGMVLTENTAVLQHVADSYPDACLAPTDAVQRARMRQWLGFIGTELHKAVFVPLLDAKAPEEVKVYAREKAQLRLDVLDRHLSDREYLLDAFTIADAYLVTVLNWAGATGVKLARWPAIGAYQQRMLARPQIARAIGEEFTLYQEEQSRKART